MSKKSTRTRKSFSDTTKQEALALMKSGTMTHKQIADKFGCSVAALTLWRRSAGNEPEVEDQWEEEEEWTEEEKEERTPPPAPVKRAAECPPATPVIPQVLTAAVVDDLQARFWSRNNRGVELLIKPRTYNKEEVLALVKEALTMGYLQK